MGSSQLSPRPLQAEVLQEFYSKDYNELTLCWGRRSGKTFMESIIATFEAYDIVANLKRKEVFSSLNRNIIIASITRAYSSIIFAEVENLICNSNFVKNKSVEANIKNGEITFIANGITCNILFYTSSSFNSWLGIACQTLIIDEPALHREGQVERIVSALTPTIKTYNGKIIYAGSPSPRESCEFFELKTLPQDKRLVSTAATWEANTAYSEKSLRETTSQLSEDQFNQEFGAQFIYSDETEQITFRLQKRFVKHLEQLARISSCEQKRNISYTDIIRELVEKEVNKERKNGKI